MRGRRHPGAPPLRLHEHLVAEIARVGQVSEHLGPGLAGGVDLDAAVTEDATDERLPGGAVLDAVDGNDLGVAAETPLSILMR